METAKGETMKPSERIMELWLDRCRNREAMLMVGDLPVTEATQCMLVAIVQYLDEQHEAKAAGKGEG